MKSVNHFATGVAKNIFEYLTINYVIINLDDLAKRRLRNVAELMLRHVDNQLEVLDNATGRALYERDCWTRFLTENF